MSIADVSKVAGVSVATVSRVINRNPQVSPASVDAVLQAMQRIGYTPPPPQQRYRGRPRKDRDAVSLRTGNVALLFPDERDVAMRTALSGRLMHGMSSALMPKHLNMLPTPLQPGGELPACIAQRLVDGVIIRGSTDVSSLMPLLPPLPCVWMLELGEVPAHGDHVLEDSEAIGQLTARYLREAGHQHAAVVNFQAEHPCYRARLKAFAAAFQRTGGTVDIIIDTAPERLATRVMELSSRPTAVFVPMPEEQLRVIYRGFMERGVRPGKDIGWVGCGYDPAFLAMLDHPVCNIDIRPEAIASAAVEMLFWRLQNKAEPQRRLLIAPILIDPLAPVV